MEDERPEPDLTGVAALDVDHARQAHTLRAIENALRRGGEPHAIQSLLLGLLEHTRQHFEAEQQLMLRSGYPGFAAHKAAHTRLLDELRGIEVRHHEGATIEASIVELRRWLFEHIHSMDTALGLFLSQAGGGAPEGP